MPAAYFDAVTNDSSAFTLPNGLFRRLAGAVIGPSAGISNPRLAQARIAGSKRMLVIPALFSDSPDPQIAPGEIQRALFDGPTEEGTLREAYLEMSRGLLDVTGVVTPWVRTSVAREDAVGESSGLGPDTEVLAYLLDALEQVDATIDFGLYDNDGPDGVPNSGDDDGQVDAIAFEFIEVAASCGGPGIWPHLWSVAARNGGQPFLTNDLRPDGVPVQVNGYITQSAVDCGGVSLQSVGTIAHEFGHVLGLPDYYHPTDGVSAAGRRWVLGCWSLMAAGSWGCGPVGSGTERFGPTHLSAYSKKTLGWLDYIDVGEVRDTEYVLDPVQESGRALRIPMDDESREFLLVEYRTQAGFDRDLPAAGLVVYHQDFQGVLRPVPDKNYFLSIVEQDGNGGLVRTSGEGGNRGEAGDAWGVDGAVMKLNAETTPGTLRHDGTPSSVTFHSLRVSDGKARVRVSTARTPEIVPPEAPLQVTRVESFERRLRVAGGFMPFQAEAQGPEGVTVEARGDEVIVSGSVVDDGPLSLGLRVVDARGSATTLAVPVTTGPWMPTVERVLRPFLGTASGEPTDGEPTDGERTYLDFEANRNGRYDVGDFRAWLRARRDADDGQAPPG